MTRSQWWHLHLSPGLNTVSVFAVDQSLLRYSSYFCLFVWGRPRGMGGGNYLILLLGKKKSGDRRSVFVVLHPVSML